jgi:hypothetical protein
MIPLLWKMTEDSHYFSREERKRQVPLSILIFCYSHLSAFDTIIFPFVDILVTAFLTASPPHFSAKPHNEFDIAQSFSGLQL